MVRKVGNETVDELYKRMDEMTNDAILEGIRSLPVEGEAAAEPPAMLFDEEEGDEEKPPEG